MALSKALKCHFEIINNNPGSLISVKIICTNCTPYFTIMFHIKRASLIINNLILIAQKLYKASYVVKTKTKCGKTMSKTETKPM